MLEVSSSNGSVNVDKKSQIPKTVRMVKRDSKDRLRDGHIGGERGFGSGSAGSNGKFWNEEQTTTTSAIISPPHSELKLRKKSIFVGQKHIF